MPRQSRFVSPVDWSHRLLAEVLHPGDLAVDLTAGNGADTLFLAQAVGPGGLVLSFDIQPQALRNTASRLEAAGFPVIVHSGRGPVTAHSGVVLIADGHETLAGYLAGPVQAVTANLGFLPGGDRQLVTLPETTCQGIEVALNALRPRGRLAVVVYVGHPGGQVEAERLEALVRNLDPGQWQVARYQPLNRQLAPYLLAVEKS